MISRLLTYAVPLLSVALAMPAAAGPMSMTMVEAPSKPLFRKSETASTPAFVSGQTIPAGFGQPIGYAQLNGALRTEYRLDPDRDYVFASGYLYDVDHQSKTVRRVIPVDIQR